LDTNHYVAELWFLIISKSSANNGNESDDLCCLGKFAVAVRRCRQTANMNKRIPVNNLHEHQKLEAQMKPQADVKQSVWGLVERGESTHHQSWGNNGCGLLLELV
jgi:hypothetical protein